MAEGLEPAPFTVDSSGIELAGESVGEGPPIVLLHGVTATRRYVVHGSNALPRRGYRQISYDARGHGESAPAPAEAGYTYRELADDLGAVLESQGAERPVLCGHSMGCHTIATYALEHRDEVAGAVLIGPVQLGLPAPDEVLEAWGRLADGLERGGVEGFMEAFEADLTSRAHGARPCFGSPASGSSFTATRTQSPGHCARCRARSPSTAWRSSAPSMSRRWWSPATTRSTRAIPTRWPRPGRRRSRGPG